MRIDFGESASRTHTVLFLTAVLGGLLLSTGDKGELAGQTVWDTNLGKEFESNAPKAWTEFRTRIANQRTQHIQQVTESADPGGKKERLKVEQFLYANGGLKLIKTQFLRNGVEGTAITALNPKYGFNIEREAGASWGGKEVEILKDALASFDAKHLLIRSSSNKKPSEAAYQRFPQDERLRIIGQPLEIFYERIKPAITSLAEREDPKLGRIVTLKYKKEIIFREQPMELEGEISFLPDKSWLMTAYDYVARPGGKADGERSESFSSEYDSSMGNKLHRARRTSKGRTGKQTTETYVFRDLSAEEIAECKKQCYLSGFGLPEQ